jgi:hypothetical protein
MISSPGAGRVIALYTLAYISFVIVHAASIKRCCRRPLIRSHQRGHITKGDEGIVHIETAAPQRNPQTRS